MEDKKKWFPNSISVWGKDRWLAWFAQRSFEFQVTSRFQNFFSTSFFEFLSQFLFNSLSRFPFSIPFLNPFFNPFSIPFRFLSRSLFQTFLDSFLKPFFKPFFTSFLCCIVDGSQIITIGVYTVFRKAHTVFFGEMNINNLFQLLKYGFLDFKSIRFNVSMLFNTNIQRSKIRFTLFLSY